MPRPVGINYQFNLFFTEVNNPAKSQNVRDHKGEWVGHGLTPLWAVDRLINDV